MTALSARRPRISPLRYPGGKAALYPRLKRLIRENGLAGCTYVEPYAGGAGAALGLLVTGQVDKVVVNDLDPAIHAFWRTLVDEPDYLRARLARVPLDVHEWRRQREIYLSAGSADSREVGFATFYLNRTNRSGVLNGGPIGGLDQRGNYKIDARFNRDDLSERIRILALYSARIHVSRRDGRDVIRQYAGREGVFLYADPPYFEKAGSLYLNAFQERHHAALARVLNNRADAAWILTYDDVPQVDRLYSDRRRARFGLHYSARRARKATEVVVISDVLQAVGDGWHVDT